MIHRKQFRDPKNGVDHLIELFEQPGGLSLLEPQHLIVPSMDYAHWLKTEIGRRSSKCIAANIQWYQPIEFIDRFSGELTDERPREQTDWTKSAMQWGLYRLMPELMDEPKFQQMPHIDEGTRRESLKWYRLAGHVADTFDKYMIYRPDWLTRWQEQPEGGRDLPENDDNRWQPHLWKRLCEQFPEFTDRARRMEKARRIMSSRDQLLQFPSRFIMVGVSTLPESVVHWFGTLNSVKNIDMYVLEWEPFGAEYPPEQRQEDATGENRRMSRLAYNIRSDWSRQRSDFKELMDEHWTAADKPANSNENSKSCATNLAQLQAILQHPGQIKESPNFDVEKSPGTLQFHSAHSPLREVEVLHEQLLECFEDDPTLRPDDILIVTPDMETYAPHINAVLDQPGDDELRIPFHRFDVGGRHRERLVELLIEILETVKGRFKVTRVLDLLAHPVLRRSLDLEIPDLERIEKWLLDLRVRWGYNAEHREQILKESVERTRSVIDNGNNEQSTGTQGGGREQKGQRQSVGMAESTGPVTGQNSWQWAMDRLWLGLSTRTGDSTFVRGRLPYNAVEGSDDSRRLGALQRLIRSLWRLHEFVQASHGLSEWSRRLSDLIGEWFTVERDQEPDLRWLIEQLGEIDEFEEQANEGSKPISVDVLLDMLKQQILQQRHPVVRMAGRAVVAPMVPVRGIPFKVIAMVGANYEDLPKSDPANPFDLTMQKMRNGDRSRRIEDRQLMLDYILSAENKLLITYTGRDQRNDEQQPPSPLITELLALLGNEERETGESEWIREHPLHGFEARSPEKTTFISSRNQQSDRAFKEERKEEQAISELAAIDQTVKWDRWKSHFPLTLPIRELQRFYAHPVRYFCQQTLGVHLREEELVDTDEEPYELGGLDTYSIYNEILFQMLQDDSWEPDLQIYREQGILPHGTIGRYAWRRTIRDLREQRSRICSDAGEPVLSDPKSIDLTMDLEGHNVILQGETCLRAGNLQCEFKTGGSLKPKNKIESWIVHLAGNAAGHELESGLWGRSSSNSSFKLQQRFPAMQPDQARQTLKQLIVGWLAGADRPLAFLPKSAYKWADICLDDEGEPTGDQEQALEEAADAYHDEQAYRPYYNESYDPYYQYFFRDVNPWRLDKGREKPVCRKLQKTARLVWKPYWEVCQ